MVEKIYDTLKAILYSDFPKDYQGYPEIYDRKILTWIFGDQKILQSPLGVVFRNTNIDFKDIGFGLREVEYTINITFYSSNDDKETSERVVLEASRIGQNILKKHRSMWVCDLCPFCGKFPLSPIHYIDNGTVTTVGIVTATLPVGLTSYTVQISPTGNGYQAPAFVKVSPGISGQIIVSEILSQGLGITATSYTDSYVQLNLTLSGGSGHTGYSTSVLQSYVSNVVNRINGYWSETHSSSSPPYYDWAGVGYQAVQMFISDWEGGVKPSTITSNTNWNNNINSVANNDANLMRLLQDIKIGALKPSDDGVEQAFLHTSEFTMKAKEIISVDQFGPNNVNVNAI